MIKFSHWIINRVEKNLNHSHSGKQIKGFVLKKYSWAVRRLENLDEQNKTEIAHDLWRIYEILLMLGWVNLQKNPFNAYSSKKQVSLSELMAWEKELWDGKALRAGVVKAGAGFYLDQLDLKEQVFQDSCISDNLESLLKHIETRREHCLQNFDPLAKMDSLRLERLNIVLLFARAARRKKDPRFLNAALKLNDWFFSYLKRNGTFPERVRFLLALVEQELTFKEMYP